MSMTGVYENIDAGNLGQTQPRKLSKTNTKPPLIPEVKDQTSTAPLGIKRHQSLPSMTPIRTSHVNYVFGMHRGKTAMAI